jgi:hypothetical protein
MGVGEMRLNEREIHGAVPMAGSSKDKLIVCEGDRSISIREGWSEKLGLTAPEARHLARKLNRLALRIEKREASEIKARRAETQSGSVHESAVPKGDARPSSAEQENDQ